MDASALKSVERHYRKIAHNAPGFDRQLEEATERPNSITSLHLLSETQKRQQRAAALIDPARGSVRNFWAYQDDLLNAFVRARGSVRGSRYHSRERKLMITCTIPVSDIRPGATERMARAWTMLQWRRLKQLAYQRAMVEFRSKYPYGYGRSRAPKIDPLTYLDTSDFADQCGPFFIGKCSFNAWFPDLEHVHNKRRHNRSSPAEYPKIYFTSSELVHCDASRWMLRFVENPSYPFDQSGCPGSYHFYATFPRKDAMFRRPHPPSDASAAVRILSHYLLNCMRAGWLTKPVTIKAVPMLSREDLESHSATMIMIRPTLAPNGAGMLQIFDTDELMGMSSRSLGSLLKSISHPCQVDQGIEAYASHRHRIIPSPTDPWSRAADLLLDGTPSDVKMNVNEPLRIPDQDPPEEPPSAPLSEKKPRSSRSKSRPARS